MHKVLKYPSVSWSMPLLFSQSSLFIPFFHELFKENNPIKYIFGAPRCKWAGGRDSNFHIPSLNLTERMIKGISKYGMTPAFTLSNTSLKKEDLDDKYCNGLLEIISDCNAEVIVVSELLSEYIRKKFPNIKICASIIKSIPTTLGNRDEAEHLNELIDKYDRVVMRPEFIIDNKPIDKIKDKNKIEILINQCCAVNCKTSKIHYKVEELCLKGLITTEQRGQVTRKICPIYNEANVRQNDLTEEQIQRCIDNGITHFKLAGRNYPFNVLWNEFFEYFFSANVNKDELRKQLDKFMVTTLETSLDLQLYYFICKKF
ncbi:MAG: hypothetical protein IJY61_06295 [Candidatus Gastranaerophilales bacterium]|nr:hypothetical protein [Candidatus Gastranaerophilales bacterium]